MKRTSKLVIVLIIIFLLIGICIKVNATIDPKDYKPYDQNMEQSIKDKAGIILGVFQSIGTFVSVGALMILGIKYMLGSIEEKAEYKSTMLPYFIGAIMVFGISNIADWIYTWAITLNT